MTLTDKQKYDKMNEEMKEEMNGKLFYEVDRVCSEEFRDYFENHKNEIDIDALVFESFDLESAEILVECECTQVKTLGTLMGIALQKPLFSIGAILVGSATYKTGGGNRFTVETKWDFTNNKQLFADDFAEMMFRDLEDHLYKHYSTAREMEE